MFYQSQITGGVHILYCRFVLASRNDDTKKGVWKLYALYKFIEAIAKNTLVHDISVLRQYAIKMLVSLPTMSVLKLLSRDLTLAYIQISEALNQDIFINPPKQFYLKPNKLIK